MPGAAARGEPAEKSPPEPPSPQSSPSRRCAGETSSTAFEERGPGKEEREGGGRAGELERVGERREGRERKEGRTIRERSDGEEDKAEDEAEDKAETVEEG